MKKEIVKISPKVAINIIKSIENGPKEVPAKISVSLGMIKYLLQETVESFQSRQKSIFEEMATLENEQLVIPQDKQQEFMDKVNPIFDNEVEMELPIIEIEDLQNVEASIDPNFVTSLMPVLNIA
ncbi:hypothetical protein [Aureibacter tunicatorum]|uniref:Uncharacterized protein n=1 Tax=Aureibacter tunicatorum TaxID=866807 RepID=A0AAE3XTU6_9BACT|nr:hypothetical protein [Aureibacter tunicatorum]MDR6241875.1 hypothetical protein [Aureibacter tunicatorum]BDD07482.1 hypothetical protein AUTU_49650 [Aureibacter tunicatorum]